MTSRTLKLCVDFRLGCRFSRSVFATGAEVEYQQFRPVTENTTSCRAQRLHSAIPDIQSCKSQQDKGLMADKESTVPVTEEEDERDLNYQPPAQKSLQEIQELDKDDESLNKYKQTLLGSGPVVSDPTVPNVQVTRLTLLCDQAPGPITMDLTGDLEALKKQNFTLKEGVDYRVKIHFKVNKEIVSGLKYLHVTYRKGIRVDKAVYMVGSYGPRVEEHEFITPVEEAPKGMMVRGGYHIKSFFTDDDKTDHLSWEWNLHIKKDWDSTE